MMVVVERVYDSSGTGGQLAVCCLCFQGLEKLYDSFISSWVRQSRKEKLSMSSVLCDNVPDEAR
jgi:hypothetical protein